jgi:hypothetical protein
MRAAHVLVSLSAILICPNTYAQLVLFDQFESTNDVSELTKFSSGDELTLVLKTWNEQADAFQNNFAKFEMPLSALDDGETFVWKGSLSNDLLNWFAPPPGGGGAVRRYRPLLAWVLNETEVDEFCDGNIACEHYVRERKIQPGLGTDFTEAMKLTDFDCYSGDVDDPCVHRPLTEIHTTVDMFDAGNSQTAVALSVSIYQNLVPEPATCTLALFGCAVILLQGRARRAEFPPTRRRPPADNIFALRVGND